MHSVKLGYLVCAITVHLLLFLFECHGNKEYVRALACVRACVVRTCTCDLSSKREHQFKDFGRSRSPGIETHAHSHTILTRNLFLRFRTCILLTKKQEKYVSYEKWVFALNCNNLTNPQRQDFIRGKYINLLFLIMNTL